ncbi:NAD+ synthase [Salinisphaera sp. USBA-960]|nr:NAD+ synthase [Salifodinibacter halophilus]NNC26543.1 NAD+ synthase [Salifodinibacter halophilus]
MTGSPLRLALAQQNVWVGDIEGNCGQIIDAAVHARDQLGADVVVCPEMALVGYPPDDLLLRAAMPDAVARALDRLVAEIRGITVVFGYPEYIDGTIYNAAAVIADGAVQARYRKQCLPNYGVFDERRYYRPGAGTCVFEIAGRRVGVTICEDLWESQPTADAAEAGAEVLVNLNCSPFHADKQVEREQLLAERARANGLAICYINCVGGQDELVFDGQTMSVAASGEIVQRAPAFDDGVFCLDVPARAAPIPVQHRVTPAARDARVYDAVVRATRDYVDRNGFPGVLVGLSGGIDSALTLAIAADAVGGDRVWAVSMPSRFTAEISNTDAADQAERLGATFDEIPIESGFESMLDALAPTFGAAESGVAEQNLQSRLRGVLLMSLSNKFGHMVLATGNKSELAVGYATLYGDMCGGFSPLKDIYKTEVYRLAAMRNARDEVIPDRVLARAPSAELAADQADTDSLPTYDVLDPIVEAYVEHGEGIDTIVARGFDRADVQLVVGLIRRNEYKRFQAAPGPKISHRAFGRDRRYPITAVYGDL